MDQAQLSSKTKKIALFGGSFDPPHRGHLAIARAAWQALELDEVLFAPVGTQPLKPGGAAASFADRVAMTRLALTDEPGFALSLVDAPGPTGQPNYSYDTLLRLQEELGAETQLFCLIGADSLAHLRLWHRAAELPFLATFVVAARPGFPLQSFNALLPAGLTLDEPLQASESHGIALLSGSLEDAQGRRAPIHLLPDLDHDMSATGVRQLLLQNDIQTCQRLLHPAVLAFLSKKKIYCG
ncbi:nicotinate (nicotinamide) nucleotide adenylyltransferase [Telmatobacter bradus]|uniref:nicotinate (nicotinamide) nucleotide adenylyltransferase n=1 Tax=Telmatobacter bradus TaxID=474953 RepID=UPI003B431CE3